MDTDLGLLMGVQGILVFVCGPGDLCASTPCARVLLFSTLLQCGERCRNGFFIEKILVGICAHGSKTGR